MQPNPMKLCCIIFVFISVARRIAGKTWLHCSTFYTKPQTWPFVENCSITSTVAKFQRNTGSFWTFASYVNCHCWPLFLTSFWGCVYISNFPFNNLGCCWLSVMCSSTYRPSLIAPLDPWFPLRCPAYLSFSTRLCFLCLAQHRKF